VTARVSEPRGWAFEEVRPAAIEQTLERQRREDERGTGPLVRARVANLVVVTGDRGRGQQALATVEALGGRAPSRCVVLVAKPPEGRQGVRAWARVVHRRPGRGAEVVWEEVVVQTNVHPRHLTAVVLPLLLPELPVFTWWTGTPPFEEEVFGELASVSDRLVVDSATFGDPLAGLVRLARAARGLQPALSDCAWGRLTPWRELLAAPFNGPPFRGAWDRVTAVRVDAVEPAAGLLLVGWLASRLGWRLERASAGEDELVGSYDLGGVRCEARVATVIGSTTLTRVDLECATGDGPATIAIQSPPGFLVATVTAPTHAASRHVGVGDAATGELAGLAAELQVFGRDRIFEEALVPAAALAEAAGPR
jgi:glucose-6-phosphate dehydrogenase assembly protein OpcA